MLAIIETHPVQYRAPVYRALQQQHGVPVTVVYGSDFSIAGCRDSEFQTSFSWDTDLLSGYDSIFLSHARPGATVDIADISPSGIGAALRRVDPKAVMIVGYSPKFHRVAWYEAWRQRRPILFRGETNDPAQTRTWPTRWARSAALRAAYAGCDALLYIGQHSLAHFRRLGVSGNRLFFSPYCVDDTAFETDEPAREGLRAEARRSLNVADDQIVILYSGKLSSRKGLALLVPAVRALPASWRHRAVLAFLGEGDQRGELEREAAAEPVVPTRFLGFQNQRHLSRYYHAADLLTLPSLHSETWGLVVNDALHHGLPCVVSDRVGCAPDLVEPGQTGHVFANSSVPAFAAALNAAYALVRRTDVREACRRKVAGYSVARAAQGIAEAYQTATAREGRQAS